jgi:exonuclease III
MAYTNLIQWNCRGVRPNYNELKLLIDKYCPIVFCLQETYIKADDPLTMRGFSFVDHYASDAGGKATGGTSILIKEGTPHSIIDLDTTLQAKAVSVSLFKTVTICSIYLSPSTPLDTQALDKLVQQLPKPFLLLGDFNAHNVVWGCHDTNNRGNIIDSFIARNGLCLLNDGSYTYMSPATGSVSALDLALCDPSVFLDFQFTVESDSYGSDHYPIILKGKCPQPEGFPRWKFKKADWELFKHLCFTDLTDDILYEADPVAIFSERLLHIAKQAIPMTTPKPKKVCKPWFNEECRNVLKERKKSLQKCQRYPSQENLKCFKIWRAKARRVVRGCKRNSWHNYVSKLNSRTSIKKTWDMIRRISGKYRPGVQHLIQNNSKITDLKDLLYLLNQ